MLLFLLACAPGPEIDKGSEPAETTDTAPPPSTETERCNGVDDDGDGDVDESGGTDWYPDADGDGYGDGASAATKACEQPDGYVASHTDCDDADAGVSPGAAEDCATDVDENCDGEPNGFEATGCTVFYQDLDRDGVGSESLQCWCEPSDSYDALATGDCDDDDPVRITDCSRPDATALTTSDTAVPLVAAGDIDGDGRVDLAVRRLGQDDLVRVPEPGSFGLEDESLANAANRSWSEGYGASADLDADGIAEVATRRTREDGPYAEIVTVSLFPSPASGRLEESGTSFEVGPFITYEDGSDLTLFTIASALGDLDGDGIDDIGFSARTDFDSRGAWLLPAAATGTTDLETLPPMLELATYTLTSCDLTGDGAGDLLSTTSRTYVFEGPIAADAQLGIRAALTTWEGVSSVSACGDLDDDGYEDVVGSQWEDSATVVARGPLADGEVPEVWATLPREASANWYVIADVTGDGADDLLYSTIEDSGTYGGLFVFEHLTGGTLTAEDATSHYVGDSPDDGFGYGLATLPDRDGDGAEDVAVGSDVGVHVFPSL